MQCGGLVFSNYINNYDRKFVRETSEKGLHEYPPTRSRKQKYAVPVVRPILHKHMMSQNVQGSSWMLYFAVDHLQM
jgi:hypothetical protein